MKHFDSERVCQYVRAHIERVTVRQAAEYFGYSPHHFSRLFHQQMGVTLRDYISAMKVAQGIETLSSGGAVIDAQLDAGYNSAGSYTQTFQSQTGLSPSKHQSALAKFVASLSLRSFWGRLQQSSYLLYAPFIQRKHVQPYSLHIDVRNRSAPDTWLFIALFPKALPVGAPALGICLKQGSSYDVVSIPNGRYYVLVCEVSYNSNPLKMMNLKGCLRDVCRTPICFPLSQPETITLTLREERPDDPPINVHPLKLLFDALRK